VGHVIKQMPPGMVGQFAEMLYGPPDPTALKRAKREQAVRHFRKIVVDAAVILIALSTVAVLVYLYVWAMETVT
jgi:hypothetical protein